ncbi:MAG: dUTP diphosphatase [Candidatus Pelagibacter sp.]|nr:dUTP diphosphatase [Candidatus Pelagibacter sp.]OUV86935.1 MAG: deoxyuridine 5'-triphosphate nucleotidohydrolase [Pelagibacteraceae bacterium TMED136]|tara:strand:+ start:19 stop:462 length:444 start_codon:yes stop_codon:yes gene_type:complete
MKSKVLIKKLNSSVNIPEYKTAGSSGLDLEAFIHENLILKPNQTVIVPTGLSIAIDNNLEIQIRPRSGLAVKSNISVLNTPGTIDADYRGEIKVILINLGEKDFIIKKGDRIAQMVICPIIKAEIEVVNELPETLRGNSGFGSTGVN